MSDKCLALAISCVLRCLGVFEGFHDVRVHDLVPVVGVGLAIELESVRPALRAVIQVSQVGVLVLVGSP